MANFLHFLSTLSTAQLHALVAYLEALSRNAHHGTSIGRAVYCGPKNLHDARTYTGKCAA